MTIPISNREIDQIINKINELENGLLARDRTGRITIAPPPQIGEILPRLSILLQQAVDPMSKIDLEFRRARAARYDRFIKEGMKKTPAIDQLKFEQDLIEMESAVNRINNFVKLTQSTITTFQTNLRLQTGIANGNL